jgi:hypothetical protein
MPLKAKEAAYPYRNAFRHHEAGHVIATFQVFLEKSRFLQSIKNKDWLENVSKVKPQKFRKTAWAAAQNLTPRAPGEQKKSQP